MLSADGKTGRELSVFSSRIGTSSVNGNVFCVVLIEREPRKFSVNLNKLMSFGIKITAPYKSLD